MMSKNKYHVILSFQSEMANEALGEFKVADGQAQTEMLDTETALVHTLLNFEKLAKLFKKNPPIFIRHLHPVGCTVPLTGTNADLEALVACVKELDALPVGRYSVQCRILQKNEREYTPFDINTALASVLQGTLDVKNPEEVLSVTICGNTAYVGFSSVQENLSHWAGGRIRFKHEDAQLSRAEFKLLEAEETFAFSIGKGDRVLDLGAAPGGWTRIAVTQGASVVAVDPAALDKSLQDKSCVTHRKQTAQEYLEDAESNFDFILNDMRMMPEESAALLNRFHPHLKDGGKVLLTLKLFGEKPKRQMLKALASLENYYAIEHVRQLFHNRSEVTVLLRK